MAHTNTALNNAKAAKQDEFYTQLSDIELEMRYYRKHFKGKTILCNCDDPFESNFFKYFVLNFNRLKLKKLIATCYANSPIAGTQLTFEDIGKEFVGADRAYKAIVTEVYDATGDGGVDMLDVAELFKLGKNTIEELEGDGDFRSPECLDLLDEADIVVTNPPFSLFREYVATLLNRDKKFIIIGSMNAIKYKEVFPYMMDNKIWLGYKPLSGGMNMIVPDKVFDSDKVKNYRINEKGEKIVNVMGVCWFTNLDMKKRHEDLILFKKYSPESYQRYVNFDAIEVSKVSDIPCDYSGFMGVPITFMSSYNPDQFELVGANFTVLNDAVLSDDIRNNHSVARRLNFYLPIPDGRGNNYTRMYDRLVIRNKNPEQPKA